MIPEFFKAFVKHYTLEGIQTFVERQEKRTDIQIDRAEIKMFGPFMIELNQEVQVDVKLRIDLTLTVTRNKYRWTEVLERYLDESRKPVRVILDSETDEGVCLTLKKTKPLYHGGIEFLEFGTIEFEYQYIGDLI